jgi:hypothetical protein
MKPLINLSENVIRFQTTESEGWATAFAINHEGQIYWITAKHVFAEKTPNQAKVFIAKEEIVKFSIKASKSHETEDIMWFQVGDDFPLKKHDGFKYYGPSNECYGKDIYALGFPYNVSSFDMSSKNKKEVPCIKRGILNSVSNKNFLVDKMMACGFSGGPILMEYKGEYKAIGVISNASFQHLYDKDLSQPLKKCKYVVPNEYTLCVNIEIITNLINK